MKLTGKSRMMKIAATMLAVILSLVFLPAAALANDYEAYVTTSNVNLRAKASTSSTSLGVLNKGTVVTNMGHEGNWYHVKVNGKEGYISSDYAKKLNTGKIIKEGSQGSDVSYLQTVLKELGIYSGDVTGNAGPKTIAAVKTFQSKYGLKADGVVGETTWAKVQALAGSSVNNGTALTATLRKGSKGPQVTELQKMLKSAGYLNGSADGTFGSQTETAVKAFQNKNGLTADGIVGKATWSKLQNATNAGTSVNITKVLKEGMKGDEVLSLQRLLKNSGYLSGSVDGIFGKQTTAAVKAFQSKNYLAADGIVGPVTLAKLKEGTTNANYTVLKVGSTGNAVRQLQQALKNLGYYSKNIDGQYGAGTVAAVKAFQIRNGLTADGIAGKATQTKLFSGSASSAASDNTGETKAAETKISKSGVTLMDWSKVKKLIKSRQVIKVYDIKSGKTYKVRQLSNGNHCDVEPLTAEDTAIIKEINNGTFQWTPHPVWVSWGDYTVAASIHSMPHSCSTIKDNNFNGHVCLHFLGSKTHNGNAQYTQDHQNAVQKAWSAAQ